MAQNQTLPNLWLLSDERNDGVLDRALGRLPYGSGFVFRHYHLSAPDRRTRFEELARTARLNGHLVVLSDSPKTALEWGADGLYGAPEGLEQRSTRRLLATAHNAAEINKACEIGADALFLSPVFPTRSHEGNAALGVERFRDLAALSTLPVIALGGMTAERARRMNWGRWGAIDGLS